MGVYYRMTDGGPSGLESYPPALEWSEIAEFSIDGLDPPGFALGLERLTLATTGRYPQWEHRLPLLLEKVNEVGGAQPPGLQMFVQ